MKQLIKLPATTQRVKINTPAHVNRKIWDKTINTIQQYAEADEKAINRRIKELDQEWDTERVLEANFAVMGICSTLLGLLHDKKWFILTGFASAFLLQHSLQGWCPPLACIRRLGIRTASEISREKTLLKFICK